MKNPTKLYRDLERLERLMLRAVKRWEKQRAAVNRWHVKQEKLLAAKAEYLSHAPNCACDGCAAFPDKAADVLS